MAHQVEQDTMVKPTFRAGALTSTAKLNLEPAGSNCLVSPGRLSALPIEAHGRRFGAPVIPENAQTAGFSSAWRSRNVGKNGGSAAGT